MLAQLRNPAMPMRCCPRRVGQASKWRLKMKDSGVELIWKALDKFKIELPSWGFANTGTRFGKFIQAAAATTIEEKFSDASQVHTLTGACPTMALHVQRDLPGGLNDIRKVESLAKEFSIRPGSI